RQWRAGQPHHAAGGAQRHRQSQRLLLRPVRFPRTPLSLAVPGLQFLGILPARTERTCGMTGRAADPAIIVALDHAEAAHALALAEPLDPAACGRNIGKWLFHDAGPRQAAALIGEAFDDMHVLKLPDMPSTEAQCCEAAARLGVWMLNVHAAAGLS